MKLHESVIEAILAHSTPPADRARRVIRALAENLPESAVEKAAEAIDPSWVGHPHVTWEPAPHLIERWKKEAIEKARSALIAALKDIAGETP